MSKIKSIAGVISVSVVFLFFFQNCAQTKLQFESVEQLSTLAVVDPPPPPPVPPVCLPTDSNYEETARRGSCQCNIVGLEKIISNCKYNVCKPGFHPVDSLPPVGNDLDSNGSIICLPDNCTVDVPCTVSDGKGVGTLACIGGVKDTVCRNITCSPDTYKVPAIELPTATTAASCEPEFVKAEIKVGSSYPSLVPSLTTLSLGDAKTIKLSRSPNITSTDMRTDWTLTAAATGSCAALTSRTLGLANLPWKVHGIDGVAYQLGENTLIFDESFRDNFAGCSWRGCVYSNARPSTRSCLNFSSGAPPPSPTPISITPDRGEQCSNDGNSFTRFNNLKIRVNRRHVTQTGVGYLKGTLRIKYYNSSGFPTTMTLAVPNGTEDRDGNGVADVEHRSERGFQAKPFNTEDDIEFPLVVTNGTIPAAIVNRAYEIKFEVYSLRIVDSATPPASLSFDFTGGPIVTTLTGCAPPP